MLNIQQLIKELNNLYPKYRFTKSNITYQAEAIINIRCKEKANGNFRSENYSNQSKSSVMRSTVEWKKQGKDKTIEMT